VRKLAAHAGGFNAGKRWATSALLQLVGVRLPMQPIRTWCGGEIQGTLSSLAATTGADDEALSIRHIPRPERMHNLTQKVLAMQFEDIVSQI
jgi:hypothetical protein